MKRVLIGLVSVGLLAFGGVKYFATSAAHVSAQDAINNASATRIDPASGETLHLTTRLFSRQQPANERLADPYHLDLNAQEPETIVANAWFSADSTGNVTREYTSVTDGKSDRVIQEEVQENGSRTISRIGLGEAQSFPAAANGSNLRTISVPADGRVTQAVDVATGTILGRKTRVVEITTTGTRFPTGISPNYERPYVRDIGSQRGIERVEIDESDNMVLRYSVFMVDARGKRIIIIDTEVMGIEFVPNEKLQADFFKLKVDNAGVAQQAVTDRLPIIHAGDPSDPRLAGRPLALLSHPQTFGLMFTGVAYVDGEIKPSISDSDLRTASDFGLALAVDYTSTSSPNRALRIAVGDRATLAELAHRMQPFWTRSAPLALTIGDRAVSGWLMTDDSGTSGGQSLIVAEIDDLMLVWNGQNLSEKEMIAAAEATDLGVAR